MADHLTERLLDDDGAVLLTTPNSNGTTGSFYPNIGINNNSNSNNNSNDKHDDLEHGSSFASLAVQRHEQVLVDEALIRNQTTTTTEVHATVSMGEKQPDGFRDVFAAVLFVVHVVVIVYLAVARGFFRLNYQPTTTSSSSSYHSDDDTTLHFAGLLFLCLTTSAAALLLAGLALRLMTRFAEFVIQFGLGLTVLCNLVLAIFFLTLHYWLGLVVALLLAAITTCYALVAWRRMAFAAANLATALTAVRANGGMVLAAFGISALVQLYTVFWLVAWLGVYIRHADCTADDNNDGNGDDAVHCTSHMNGIVVFFFLLSYYWTAQVGKNLLHVTVSGVVGTFLFYPDDATSFCSPAITDSFTRASTWSFGSICLGSLFTAILHLLFSICQQARRQAHRAGQYGMLLCVLECLVGMLERLVAYFNKWAYCYIGLYGYDYLTAGVKVLRLFSSRGWSMLITDELVTSTLSLMSLVVGLGTGAIGLLVAQLVPAWVEAFRASTVVAFLLPALIGTALAYIMFLSVVGAAVDTVIVVFAEAPLEFERNHPGLYRQMVTAWRLVYPDEFHS